MANKELMETALRLRGDGAISPKQFEGLQELDALGALTEDEIAAAIAGTKQPEEMGMTENMLRGLGRGVAATPGIPGSVIDFINSEQMPPAIDALPNITQTTGFAERALGTSLKPNPESFMGKVGEFVGGGLSGGIGGIARKAAAGGVESAARAIGANTAGSVGAAAGSEMLKGMGPGGELAGGVLGVAAPAGLAGLAKTALRGFGAEKQQATKKALELLQENAGRATAGTVAAGGMATTLESTLHSVPGSIGRYHKVGDEIRKESLARLQRILKVKPGQIEESLDERAGGIISGLISKRAKIASEKSTELYTKARSLVDVSSPIPFSNTRAYLEQVSGSQLSSAQRQIRKVQGGPNVADVEGIADEKLKDLLFSELNTSKGLPYEELDALRKSVGKQIKQGIFADDNLEGFYRGLYKNLSSDLADGAQAIGGTEARQAVRAANAYWSAERKLTDRVLNKIKAKEPELDKLFRAVVNKKLDNTTMIKQVLRGLDDDESRRVIAAAWIAKVGRLADDGSEGIWNIESFVKNWRQASPSSRRAILSGDLVLERELTRFSEAMGNIADKSKVLANPSGTGARGMAAATLQSTLSSMAQIATVGATAGTVAGGVGAGTLSGIAASFAGAHLGARLFTSAPFVKWLADTAYAPVDALPKNLARLQSLIKWTDDPLLVREMENFATTLEAQAEIQADALQLDNPRQLRNRR